MTTEAGKRLHDARHLPDYCSDPCELREEVAAIEAEARIDGRASGVDYERARLAEAVRRTFDPYDGPWQQDQREGWEDCRAAVLAILEK